MLSIKQPLRGRVPGLTDHLRGGQAGGPGGPRGDG